MESLWQRARQATGELPAVDAFRPARCDQQFAYPVTVLQHLPLQPATIANQVARSLVLQRQYTDRAHAVSLATQPSTRVNEQLDDIKPVRLRAPLLALDRITALPWEPAIGAALSPRTGMGGHSPSRSVQPLASFGIGPAETFWRPVHTRSQSFDERLCSRIRVGASAKGR